MPAGPLVNYGYEGEVLHLVVLEPQRTLRPGRARCVLKARADWLVCKELCIPEGADLTLALPVATTAAADPRWGAPIAATRAALPRPLAGWQATAPGKGQTIELKLVPPAGAADPGALYFFPYAESLIEPSRPQTLARDGDAYVLTLPVSFNLTGEHRRIDGVLTAANGFGGGVRAATIDVALTGDARRRIEGRRSRAAPALNLSPPPAPEGLTLALGTGVRARRRHDPEPDALRVPGAVAQGARLRDASRQQGRRCTRRRSRSRPASC